MKDMREKMFTEHFQVSTENFAYDDSLGMARGRFVALGVMSQNKSAFFNNDNNKRKIERIVEKPLNLNHFASKRVGFVKSSILDEVDAEKTYADGEVILWKNHIESDVKKKVTGFSIEATYDARKAIFEHDGNKYTFDEAQENGVYEGWAKNRSYQGKPVYVWIDAEEFYALALVTKPYEPAYKEAQVSEIEMKKEENNIEGSVEEEKIIMDVSQEEKNTEEKTKKEGVYKMDEKKVTEMISEFLTSLKASLVEGIVEAMVKVSEKKEKEVEKQEEVKETEDPRDEEIRNLKDMVETLSNSVKELSEKRNVEKFIADIPEDKVEMVEKATSPKKVQII